MQISGSFDGVAFGPHTTKIVDAIDATESASAALAVPQKPVAERA